MKKIRVLHIITESEPYGGAQINTLVTLIGLDKSRYQVELACGPGGPLISRAEESGINVTVFPNLVREINPKKDVITAIQLFKFIKAKNFNIVHTHSSKAGILGRLVSYLVGVPIIVHTIHGVVFHSNQPILKRKAYTLFEKIAAAVTDKMIAVGEIVRDEFLLAHVGSPKQYAVIHSGIDFRKFNRTINPRLKKRELELSEDAIVIGTVGNLVPCKGHQYLIDAFSIVKQHLPNAHLILVGDGYLRQELQKQVESLHLDSDVSFLGRRDDVPELLQIMDVFVISSLWEGVGRALTEAMYMQRPVVATAVNGVPELVEHGVTGILIPPKDTQALAKAILELIQNKKQSAKFGRQAKKKVYPEFAVELMVERIECLYEQLLRSIRKDYEKYG